MIYTNEFKFAKEIALDVGHYLSSQIEKKIDSQIGRDIKLELDKKVEKLIIDSLIKNFMHSILSEEAGLIKELKDNEPYWIVDPIDGSLNFSRENPVCCVSIALWINKEPIFGVIYDFNRRELFSGYVGVGAWLNGTRLVLHTKKKKSQSILATGFSTYMSDDEITLKNFIFQIREYKKIRMIGSAAISLAYVACGRFDVYLENNIKIWDIAAGIAINQAVGNIYEVKHLNNFETNTKVGIE